MKKLLLVLMCFSAVIQTACEASNNIRHETFKAEAIITVSDVEFNAQITETSVEFTSENLSEPIRFENNIAVIEDFSKEIAPQENSAFYISDLILEVVNTEKSSGYYKDTEYSYDFDKSTRTPKTIFWGNIFIKFIYFEQGS